VEAHLYEAMLAAEDHHWWFKGTHDLVVHFVQKESLRRDETIQILDAGCGTGRLCQLLAPLGSVTGCDSHPFAVKETLSRGVSNVRVVDLCDGGFAEQEFDVITLIDVISHQRITDDSALMKDLHRALRNGGLLVVQVAALEWLRGSHDEAAHIRHRYLRHEVAHLLTAAGFCIEFSSYRLPGLLLPIFIWRRLFGQSIADSDLDLPCPVWLNWLLDQLVRMENRLLCLGMELPFGSSLVALGRKL